MINLINPIILSKYVVNRSLDEGFTVNALKLQKLLYYIEAWHLVYFEKPLFKEQFEAWVHGPVIREVFEYYRDFRLYDDITKQNIETNLEVSLTEDQIELINDTLDEYGDKTGYHLECLTHDELPWKKARRGYSPSDRCDEIISKAEMKDFYSEMAYGSR